jgi:hypothetical protein
VAKVTAQPQQQGGDEAGQLAGNDGAALLALAAAAAATAAGAAGAPDAVQAAGAGSGGAGARPLTGAKRGAGRVAAAARSQEKRY